MLVERSEHKLLLSAASRNLTTTTQIQSLVHENVDWAQLLELANEHGVIPLLQQSLKMVNGELPPAIQAQLRDCSQEVSKFNLLLSGELIKLFDLFESHRVRVIFFKGPTLALRAYNDVGLRQFCDLDVLVKREDISTVIDLLSQRGFKPEPALTEAQQAALLRFGCSQPFRNHQNLLVDIHWDFAERYLCFDTEVEELWRRHDRLTFGGREVPTLSVEDLLFVLCIHGFTHTWDRLGWICDIAGLLDPNDHIDWDCVMERASRKGARRVVSLGLLLAGRVLGAALPAAVIASIQRDVFVNEFAERIRKQLFTKPKKPFRTLEETVIRLKMRERVRDKLHTLVSAFATPRTYDWMSSSNATVVTPYLMRPIRLTREHGAALLRRPR